MKTTKKNKSERGGSVLLRLRQQLKAEPRHHWVLTRISSEYYEQGKYALALKYAEKAFAEVPSCPLVLWDLAGALQALGRHNEALDLYAYRHSRDRSSRRRRMRRRKGMGQRTRFRFALFRIAVTQGDRE